jgi:hypothetical protein
MNKADRKKKEQKPSKHTPARSKAVIELTEQELKQAQGGSAGLKPCYIGETEKAAHHI